MMLRTTQTLVRGELAIQSTSRPLEPATLVGEQRGHTIPAPIHQPVDGAQELAAAVRDNVDPYLVSQSVNTPAGRDVIYELYGQHEGGGTYCVGEITVHNQGQLCP